MKLTTKDLAEMLSFRRHPRTPGEEVFIHTYIDTVPGMNRDAYGNRFIKIGNSDTAFCCHTDTVHPPGGEPRQKVYKKGKWLYVDQTGMDPLGGDDTTGVWLCLNMIHNRVPGLYIFHREEEGGTRGSRWIAQNNPSLLSGINKIISFDRKGYEDVISHQSGKRTCSDEFATELAKQLGGGFKPSSRGVFTDSAVYQKIVPECSNLSIGYFNAHSPKEIQDIDFAKSLLKRLLKVNWKSLPVKRNPNEPVQPGTPLQPLFFGNKLKSNQHNDKWKSNRFIGWEDL